MRMDSSIKSQHELNYVEQHVGLFGWYPRDPLRCLVQLPQADAADAVNTGTLERETADHFLLRCSRYSQARSVMKNYVYEMCFTDNKKRHLKLTDGVLLAPA